MFSFHLKTVSVAHIITAVVGTKIRFSATPLCCGQQEHKAYTAQNKTVTGIEINLFFFQWRNSP
jgi:hypothetical protein